MHTSWGSIELSDSLLFLFSFHSVSPENPQDAKPYILGRIMILISAHTYFLLYGSILLGNICLLYVAKNGSL